MTEPARDGHPVTKVAMSVGAALAAYVIAVNLFVASRGLDRTDEGMYLNSIRHPEDDVATVLLFGYVYHPAYAAVGGTSSGCAGSE